MGSTVANALQPIRLNVHQLGDADVWTVALNDVPE
jgi:hypothetical protein